MIWSVPALQDATIYEGDPNRNTGLDEILELQAGTNTDTNEINEARILLKFDLSTLDSMLTANKVDISAVTASLILRTVQSTQLPNSYILSAHPIGDSWANGSGYTTYPSGIVPSTFTTDGVTWSTVNGTGSPTWVDAAVTSSSTTFYSATPGGGDWFPLLASTASFTFKSDDNVNIDVSDIVRYWNGKDIVNNGVLVKFYLDPDNSAFSSSMSTIQLYSAETHTVYQPQIIFGWPSNSYVTSSVSASFGDDIVVYTSGYRAEYKQNSKIRIKLGSRLRYPRPTFSQNTSFSSILPLPQNTRYQIRDSHSNEIIIPHSPNTLLSTDVNGSYFDFYSTMLYAERYYTFEIIVFYEDDTTFGLSETISSTEFQFKIIQ